MEGLSQYSFCYTQSSHFTKPSTPVTLLNPNGLQAESQRLLACLWFMIFRVSLVDLNTALYSCRLTDWTLELEGSLEEKTDRLCGSQTYNAEGFCLSWRQ